MAQNKKWHYQTTKLSSGIKDDEYACKFRCQNCNEQIYIAIKMGVTEKEIIPQVKCSRCGCKNETV